MNDLSFFFIIVIKIVNIYAIFKKRFKRKFKNKRSPGAWEYLELWLQLEGKHGSGVLRFRVPDINDPVIDKTVVCISFVDLTR